MIARLVVVATLIATTVGLSACSNTVRGAGRDIERSGEAVQRGANNL